MIPEDEIGLQAPPTRPPAADATVAPPPHSMTAERSALSIAMQYPEATGQLIEAGIRAEHFYALPHQVLFRYLLAEWERNRSFELVDCVHRLHELGQLESIGGPAVVAEIYGYAFSPAGLPRYIEALRHRLALREIMRAAGEAAERARTDDPETVGESLDRLEADAMRIRAIMEPAKTAGRIDETVMEVCSRIAARLEGESLATGRSTGFDGLDKMGVRLKAGEMFVVAARPSMGKTALMMNLVENIVFEQEGRALVFSAEMTSSALIERLLFSMAKLNPSSFQNGLSSPTKGELQRLQREAERIGRSRLEVVDRAPITVGEIRAIARRRHRETPLDVIAIDYLQYLRHHSGQAKDSREREVAEISGAIKALAKELSIPIILLAQLNRGPESRTGKAHGIPRMSDLRESGAIEQDADIISLLYRPGYYAGQGKDDSDATEAKDDGRAKLIIAKNRNGQTGDVDLTWIAPLTRFEDGAPATPAPAPAAPRSRFDFMT